MTKHFYGTKRIVAWPAERDGAPGYGVEYADGYKSWSPKAAFEEAYQPIDAMSFGHAIAALKAGHRVARAGWNGKGMWLSLSCDQGKWVDAKNFWSPHNRDHADAIGGAALVLPSITMKTADGAILMGWLASQTDMLSDDWQIVE